jgi:hypothetical protein
VYTKPVKLPVPATEWEDHAPKLSPGQNNMVPADRANKILLVYAILYILYALREVLSFQVIASWLVYKLFDPSEDDIQRVPVHTIELTLVGPETTVVHVLPVVL